jgi:hypothetical protein
LVQVRETIVDYSARPTVVLRDDANRRDAQGGLFAYKVVREDHPLALGDHARHFFGEEVGKFEGGFVGAALAGLVLALERPRRSAELALYANVAHVLE